MDLDIERFSQLGNTLLVASQNEDYYERRRLAYLAYVNVQLAAGKKAPSWDQFVRKQKLDARPELEYLWEVKAEKGAKQGDAGKAAKYLGSVPELEETGNEEEDREAVAEQWGSMSVADLQAYKAQKERGL
jgi:hypothetical protein